MSQHMKQLRMNPVRDAVFTSLYSDKRAQALNEFFKYGAEIYVLAGALRDAIAAHYEGEGDGTPRDFDIAVADISRGEFDKSKLILFKGPFGTQKRRLLPKPSSSICA